MFPLRWNRAGTPSRRALLVSGAWMVATLPLSAAIAADPPAPSVRLVIDFGDGVETHYKALGWREGMTVLDALEAAKAHRRGLAFSHRGSGSSALITRLGDLENEGGGAKSKNWMYSVNGKPATVGAGVYELNKGDTVLWKFQIYSYNPGS